ncbi:xanthine dehydrogenase family protein molybdopterin-binding subunit [Neorhizobium galegae]|uniref:xanthine dehydrogenase family protein molybdopterin-binding subunit n=1 Tax=Neorhizobium galegae TaxID=399 RepID=UPI001F206E4F|nr:molybdopterin cofactor-binding domain-containing protein [Neorhizobium galegae]UIK08046.1 molybdopterin-dependent oxidoreductase [Neorhizobium galegae]
MTMITVSRRGFLASGAAAAAGLTIGFHVPFAGDASAQSVTPEINAWVVIKSDDTVVVRVARVEMGQGTLTGLAQLVAEELECDWDKVTWEYPTPGENVRRGRVWQNFGTAGSQGIRQSNDYVRKGGAAARMMLVQAAANEWKVPVGECTVAKGVITHVGTSRSTSYGKVAAAASLLTPPAADGITLKDPKTWTIAGRPLKRLDTAEKLNGRQVYSIDMKLPGMLNAALKVCPVFGGKIKGFDVTQIEKMPGFKKAVRLGDTGVAVIADTWWRAKTALDALPIEWDDGPNGKVQQADILAAQEEGLTAREAILGSKNGDVAGALASATRTVEAVYAVPHQHHVTMEPMNATALWTAEKCEVWTATQNAEAALATAAEVSGLPIDKNEVYRLHLGGGFGRRSSSHDFVRYAVLIAKEMPATPIKTIWSREEDMTHGWYHPSTQCRLVAGFDEQDNLSALHMRISGQSILATLSPDRLQNGRDAATFQGLNPQGPESQLGYTVPNLLIEHAMRNPHVPAGFWRGVNNNQNAIYLECFLDELAHSAKQDPLEFRRKLMANHPKHLAVLDAVTEKVGWGTPAPAGVYRGIAQQMGFGSYVAACAEVSVSDAGILKIHRIVAATDCGHAVNPQQIAAQVEGSFVYGLTAALYGEITVANGRVEQENFDTYQMLRMDEMFDVETIIMPSGGFWGGVGEPTIFVAAPAVLNAIFAATGIRVRQVPLSKTSLKKA